ncbi:(R)-mandelonitrile lyase [Amycolatopsis australiensis]|uniref:Cupin domain protein n=1 Tax=Amycolatopsis australiensis TaxID=546364 RepID=A0A1K1SMN4_9PSEU|nr:cupin domain-containing protein [Amycolatopsis australiensis]SFW85558.1 Cupin domain protein [Amycolatopsis australiensis]
MEFIPLADTVRAPAERFTGAVHLTMLKTPSPPSRLVASLVRFTPGARTHWHSHAVGQTLHVTEGAGLVVNRDGQVIRMRAGDTVWTPPGEEHWHGGTTTTCLSHIAMLEAPEQGGDGTTWLEPVTDEQYAAAHRG